MPNHTDNRVTLSHKDPQMIDYIYNIMNTEDTELLNHIIPMPPEEELASGWYEWRTENWGTKWDIYESHCDRIDANTLHLYFNTAWSPPIPVFHKLVDMGFDINAQYFDEGWLFIGQFTADDGVVDDFYTSDVENVRDSYPELDEEFGISEMLEEERAEASA
jgi:hypothetical protein